MFCVQNMGLSSKQVSGGGEAFDWVKNLMQGESVLELPKMNQVRQQQQQQQQQLEPLKCPRCDSTNTKFCYYNNYNKLQPRHFCKSCRRHWTKGGTLRNVPVGGGRKNKRLKTNGAATTTTTVASTNNSSRSSTGNISIVPVQHVPVLGFGDDHEKNMSEILYQSLLLQPNSIRPVDYTDGISESTASLDSLLLPPPTFNVSSSSMPSINNSGCLGSTSYMVDYTGQAGKSIEYPTTPQIMPWCSLMPCASSSLMDSSSSNWNWEDLNYSLVSSDLKQPYLG